MILHLDFSDFSFTAISLYNLTVIELGIAVIVTSGMGLRPLVEKLFSQLRWDSIFSGRRTAKNIHDGGQTYGMNTILTARGHNQGFETLVNATTTDEEVRFASTANGTTKTSASAWPDTDHEDETPSAAIMVTREFVVEREHA